MKDFELHCIAGDDLTLAVDFTADGQALELTADDRAELILHFPDGTDELVAPDSQKGNVAMFALTGAKTKELMKKNPTGKFRYCIRLRFADGTQHTPVHREPLIIERC